MSELVINGQRPLHGEISIHGAKNAVLPILAACILNPGECVLHNCPDLKDVTSAIEILKYLGCTVQKDKGTIVVNSKNITCNCIPDELMREMRSSVIFLGAVISRCKQTKITYPGGCELGPRPSDLHLKSLQKLGIKIRESHGEISAAANTLTGSTVYLDFPSVGATENLMLAAVKAKGRTKIINCAKEPEIVDLQNFLNQMGCRVRGGGTAEIMIDGVAELHDAEHDVIPDRIVAATVLSAVGLCGGDVCIKKVIPEHIASITSVVRDCGCDVTIDKNEIRMQSQGRVRAIDKITTSPYPGFPTDAQPVVMAMLTCANGSSIISETIFENRFKHVDGLLKMGADVKIDGRTAVIRGVPALSGADVRATDLRGGAALLVAALGAKGVSRIGDIYHIDRGYESIETMFTNLGAQVAREK